MVKNIFKGIGKHGLGSMLKSLKGFSVDSIDYLQERIVESLVGGHHYLRKNHIHELNVTTGPLRDITMVGYDSLEDLTDSNYGLEPNRHDMYNCSINNIVVVPNMKVFTAGSTTRKFDRFRKVLSAYSLGSLSVEPYLDDNYVTLASVFCEINNAPLFLESKILNPQQIGLNIYGDISVTLTGNLPTGNQGYFDEIFKDKNLALPFTVDLVNTRLKNNYAMQTVFKDCGFAKISDMQSSKLLFTMSNN